MTLSDEIELKLEVAPGSAAAIAALPELTGIAPVVRRQSTTYFDTPEQDLRRAGLSLRVRRSGATYVQTVKAEPAAATGLFARHEWERPVSGGRPELDGAEEVLARLLAQAAPERLAPAFRTIVKRTRWDVTFAGSRIALLLDEGRVRARTQAEPVCEIELELIEGEPAALFGLARAIAAQLPVRLGVLAKSDRGYRLLDGERSRAPKAPPVALDAAMTAADAFRTIMRGCLRHYRLNEELLLATRRAAPLHQARVALRRLRSALAMFAPMIGDAHFADHRAALRLLAAELGDARDLDVLVGRMEDPDALRLLEPARERAYDRVCEKLAAADTRLLLLDLAGWITVGPWLAADDTAELRRRDVERFARDLLARYRRGVKRSGKRLVKLDDDARHEVRIRAKKLRYAAEFFAGLYASKSAARRRRAFLAALETLQEKLGELNDRATGAAVLEALGIPDAAPASDAPRDRRRLLAEAEAAYDALIDVKRFWRS